ncbi:MAG: beta-lactamase family protein [Flavipsychrobacter sp.]|nr:beta-lactamase family protein [Flavipsychrobacter sp.]
MKKILLVFLFFLTAFSLSSQNKTREQLLLDKYASAYAKTYNFNGAILVSKDNKIIYQSGFGSANREWSVPNTTYSKFPIASLTKQFTAVAILQLAEQGMLSLEDPIVKFFPDFPSGDSITIHMLLNHTSGLKEFSQYPGLFDREFPYPHEVLRDTIINKIKRLPLNFPPGSFWGYSNTNYVLLGYILELITDEQYDRYIKATFFKELNMLQSRVLYQDSILPNKAYGYSGIFPELRTESKVPFNYVHSHGGLVSTVTDLLKWNQALHGGKLLKREYYSKMHTPNQPVKGAGYGIFIDYLFDHKTYSHNGNIPGYSSSMIYFPHNKSSIIILSNRETNLDFFAKGLAGILFNKEMVIPYKHKKINGTNFKDFEAKFETPFPFEVVEKEGRLLLNMGRELELRPESKTKLFVSEPDIDIQLEYVFDANRKIQRVHLIEGGVKTQATLRR